MKVEQLLNEATDAKGAVAYVQSIFDKAGLTIGVTSRSKTELLCKGQINRNKFSFTINLSEGRRPKVTVNFVDFDVAKLSNMKGVTSSTVDLTSGRGLDSLYAQIRNFGISADNNIAELKVVKTFLMRLARCLDKISMAVQK